MTVNLNGIHAKLLAESGYTTRSRQALGAPDEVTESMLMTDDEKRILESWVRSALNEAAHTIGQHFGQCSVKRLATDGEEDKRYIISFPRPHNYPVAAIEQLKECVTELAIATAQQQWSMTVKPDEANIAAVRVQQARALMKGILTMRTRPSKGNIPTDNVIEL